MNSVKFITVIFFATMFSSCAFNMFFYYPDSGFVPAENIQYTEHFLPSSNGKKIHTLVFEPDSHAKANILILHGNAGSLSGWMTMSPPFTEAGYRVIIFDYRGFGISEGRPSHKGAFSDAVRVLDFICKNEQFKKQKTIVYGLSLGGNLAVKLALENQERIHALVIEGAFTNQRDIATHITPPIIKPFPWLLSHSYIKGEKLIRSITIPKLIIHSIDDEVVPFKMAKEYEANARAPKEFWQITGKHLGAISYSKTELIEKFNLLID
jgi:uncharacterized protein